MPATGNTTPQWETSMTEPNEPDDLDDAEGTEQLGDAGKRALDAMKAKLRAERQRIKELEPLAAKARDADEAAKTEAQKAGERTTAAERERDEARTELLRYKVATAKGLTAELAARLRGETEEELTKDADELLKLVKPATQTTSRPVPDLRSGALPANGAPAPSSSADIDEWIRRKAGRRS